MPAVFLDYVELAWIILPPLIYKNEIFMDVSVVIVNYKTPQMVVDCINSVISRTDGISYEIIVVDNNSQDDIGQMIGKEFGHAVRVIQLEENLGFGKANNEGIKKAKGRNIFCLNPDTILLNNAIKVLSDFLDNNGDAGACGGNLYDKDMKPSLSFRRIFPGILWELHELSAHLVEKAVYRRNWNFNHTGKPLNVAYITGADLMLKREAVNTDETFSPLFFMYCEDTDLCLQIKRKGYKIMSVPDAMIMHLEGSSTNGRGQDCFSEKGLSLSEQGRITYYRKNKSPVARSTCNAIYWCSLHWLYFMSMVLNKKSRKAFKFRINMFKSLNGSQQAT